MRQGAIFSKAIHLFSGASRKDIDCSEKNQGIHFSLFGRQN